MRTAPSHYTVPSTLSSQRNPPILVSFSHTLSRTQLTLAASATTNTPRVYIQHIVLYKCVRMFRWFCQNSDGTRPEFLYMTVQSACKSLVDHMMQCI